MSGPNAERCRYPGCTRAVAPAPPGGGRPPSYCSDPSHNRVRAFRARQRSAADVPEVGCEPGPQEPWSALVVTPELTPAVTPEARLAAETRRADRAEAVAEERRAQVREIEERAERRIADLLDRLMVAGDEVAELRAELAMLRRGAMRMGREPEEQACGGAG